MLKRVYLTTELILIFLLCLFQMSVFAETTYKVKSTDNISKIIKTHYKESDLNKSQIMIGILAENPNAFRRGNINALKDNQELLLPDPRNLKLMDQEQASILIKKHHKHFRQRAKKTLAPPFDSNSSNTIDMNALANMQQAKINELKKLETERAELLARVEKLIKDKKDMDSKLQQLDEETKEE